MCDMIILICLPEQIPYFKHKYGDALIDIQDFPKGPPFKIDGPENRPVSIYYFSLSEKYRNSVDTDVFNVFWASNIMMKAMEDTYNVECPTHFFYCFPQVCVMPHFWLEQNERGTAMFRNIYDSEPFRYKYNPQENNRRFRFLCEDGDKKYSLPRGSHVCLFVDDVKEIWKYIHDQYQSWVKQKITKEQFMLILDFEKLIEKYNQYIKYKFPIRKKHVHDTSNWQGYVDLLNSGMNEDNLGLVNLEPFFIDNYIKNMGKLTYHLSGPMIEEDAYLIKKVRKDHSKEFFLWTKRRKKLRHIKKDDI